MSTAEGVGQMEGELPQEPFTLVMEVDAWNIRERDKDWGRSEELRKEGRWHLLFPHSINPDSPPNLSRN
jgi:hypothetical protein